MDKTKSKTIHVDFGSKKVLKVDEYEFEGTTVTAKKTLDPIKRVGPFGMMGNLAPDMSLEPTDGNGLFVDPAAYLESVIVRFEEHLNRRGCFDENVYSDPQTFSDALNTFKVLRREIPMLMDTMNVLREIIIQKTGDDPAGPEQIKFNKKPTN